MEVYLDNAATTKPTKEVVEAVVKALEEFYGNPSSLHRKGVLVEKEIKRIRKIISKALGCYEQEIYFTSGGTESNNIAIKGIVEANKRKGNHLVTTKIEHKSVLDTFKRLEQEGYQVTYLDVDSKGFISIDQLKDIVTENTIFVSIMHVNNEVGSIQPIKEAGKIIKQKSPSAIFHVDAVQSFGKVKFTVGSLGVDSLSFSGHKIHGPKGIGALYVNKKVKFHPILTGGGQEMGIRAGTENVPGIFGLGEAVEFIFSHQEELIHRMEILKEYFINRLQENLDDIYIHSSIEETFAPHIINVSFKGIKSEILLHSLEQDGIYVSSGSACSSKKRGYSHVLTAMKMKESLIDSAVRISLSYNNKEKEIDYAVKQIKKHLENLRKILKR